MAKAAPSAPVYADEPAAPAQNRDATVAQTENEDASAPSHSSPAPQAEPPPPSAAPASAGTRSSSSTAASILPPPPSTERYDVIEENGFRSASTEPLSTFSVDVDTASYSNVRRFLSSNQRPPADAIRVEELINYFDYDYEEPTGKHPFSVNTEVAPCPWAPEHQLVHVGIAGKHVKPSAAPARNLVFLIDVSGSMDSADKLGLLKRGLRLLSNNIRRRDRVSIVVYAGSSGVVLQPTNNRRAIKRALKRLEAGGSTAGASGLELAYNIAAKHFDPRAANRVILASDGDFNVGPSSQEALVELIEKHRRTGVYLSVLGFGKGNLNDAMMEQIADRGNGNYAYIDNLAEARRVLVERGAATLIPIAKDVKLQVEFNPNIVESYRLVGYENRHLENEDFENDQKDAGDIGAGHTVTALYEVIPTKSAASGQASGQTMQVDVRYKAPDGHRSTLIEHRVTQPVRAADGTSENFRFSAAVAMFGMALRGSEYVGPGTMTKAIALAKGAVGADPTGHRKAFVQLATKASSYADGQ